MSRPCSFGLGLLLGALGFPLGYLLAYRISGRHFLSIKES